MKLHLLPKIVISIAISKYISLHLPLVVGCQGLRPPSIISEQGGALGTTHTHQKSTLDSSQMEPTYDG